MARRALAPPATPAPAVPAPEPGRTFRPALQETRPIQPSNEGDAIARIAERRRGRAAPAPQEPARPEVDPGDVLGVTPHSPLAGLVEAPVVPGVVPGTAPAPALGVLPSQLFDVVVNGQVQHLTLDELRRGYLRQQDYSSKTAALSAQMAQAQEMHAAFDHARQQLEARAQQLATGLEGEFSQPIDWVRLAREDPIGYAQKDARHKQFLAAQQERHNLAQLRANEELARKQEMRRLGHEFLAQVLPGWRDPASRQQLQALQMQHLQEVGYTPEEIAAYEALDPRQIVILEESRRFRALVAAHPDLLRVTTMRAEPPQARGAAPQALPGNGLLATREPLVAAETQAQQDWDQARDRGGAAAREAAVSLIAARRARRQ